MTERMDCLVVGAGVVGLACARALALQGREVVVVEREAAFGMGTSSRNSGVIHSGIYYPPGSLKSRLCRRGRELLYEHCDTRGVAHRRCGKLLVATDASQIPALEAVHANAVAAGIGDLQPLSAAQAVALEPALRCVAALLVPMTGIVDSQALMLSLLGEAERNGAVLALGTEVLGGRVIPGGFEVRTGGSEAHSVQAALLVNCAGLSAQTVAGAIDGLPAASVPPLRLAKGNYFALSGRAPFSRLIYPMPEAGGLGVHLTLDLGGQARFGPDVQWVDEVSYRVDPARAAPFYAAIRRYWPGLVDGALRPDFAGVRPKLAQGGAFADFVIDGPSDHGVPGLVQLFGIESPGLTSALAIGEYVARLAAHA